MTILIMNNHPQVIDYNRLKRISPQSQSSDKTEYNVITQICMLFIFIGFSFLIKRFKDKQARIQSDIAGTLQKKGTHLFS